jgi:hypothetical protein
MGNELFGVDIAGIVADALGDGLLDVTITRRTVGARQAGNLTGGPQPGPVETFDCAGFWEDFTGTPPPNVELELGDRKAVLIGDTIPAGALPLVLNDEITIEELTLYFVKVLSRDPAAAVYTLLCRARRSQAV